jgi:protein-disulfide isomerase
MNPHTPRLIVPVGPRDHVLGRADAPVVLLEYGDFQCPYCGAAHPEVERVRQRMGKRMAFVYRHFPLTTLHPRAQPAAEASEAAGAQGRFWDMHAILFERQDALEDEDLLTYAQEMGLNLERFASELVNGTHAAKVRNDFMTGVRSGVNGTPTFFINGLRYNGSADASSLLAAMESHAFTASDRA